MSAPPPPYTPPHKDVSDSFQGPPPQPTQLPSNIECKKPMGQFQEDPVSANLSSPSGFYNPQLNPVATTRLPLMITADVTTCSEPTIVSCPFCKTIGMTTTKKLRSCCQITSIVFFAFFALPISVLIFLLCDDIEHRCKNCGNVIGIKRGYC